MLTQTASASTARKGIIIGSADAVGGTVLYTVPTGKSCVGSFGGYTGGYFTLNAMTFYPYAPYGPCHAVEVTLIAGTVIKAGPGGAWFIGVEQ